jgi:hypothetical protein
MMRKTIKFGAALAGLTLAATVVGTSPAAAGTRDCRYGNFCAWTDDNFSGGIAQWGGNDPSWYDNGMHDNAESVYNNGNSAYTNDHVQVFEDINYGNLDICVNPGETYDAGMDDNDYDSHKWVDRC